MFLLSDIKINVAWTYTSCHTENYYFGSEMFVVEFR